MDQLVDSFGIENVLSVVVLVLGTVGSADLIAQLAECVSVVAFARVTDADGARNALDLTTPDVAIVAMSATWAEAVLGEPLLTLVDVAAHVGRRLPSGRPANSLYQAVKRGELPAYRVSGRWRVRRSDIEAWLARHRELPRSA